MVTMNEKMHMELEGVCLEGKTIPPELLALLAQGFLEIDGRFFLQSLSGRCLNVSDTDFPDKTGFECFVNSIHIDDYVKSDYLMHALLFIEACFESWRSFNKNDGKLAAIISNDEYGAVVKLHFLRAGEPWLGKNLEKYEDAVFYADSSSLNLH